MKLQFLFISLIVLLTSSVYAMNQGNICDNQYALCTSARCIPDPSAPHHQSICTCDVQKGKNFGFSTCDKRIPKEKNGVTTLLSTFSFAQFPDKKVMVCQQKQAWSDCLDYPCTIDPVHPSKAICACKIRYSANFVTVGGSCDTSTCSTGFWSGATMKSAESSSDYFAKMLNISNTMAENYCER